MKELRSITSAVTERRTKRLFIQDRTVKFLQRYVDEQRGCSIPIKRNLPLPLSCRQKLLRYIHCS